MTLTSRTSGLLLFAAAVLPTGCATEAPSYFGAPPPVHDDRPAPPPSGTAPQAQAPAALVAPSVDRACDPNSPFDPKAVAQTFDHSSYCEVEARRIKAAIPDRGWALLRACITRRDFTDIRIVLNGAWDEDLRTRTDAAAMLTKLVAMRGGEPVGDVALMQEHQIPVFTLAAAIAQPETYKGRLILFRAQVSEIRNSGGKPTVALDETCHGSTSEYTGVGGRASINTSGHSRGGAYDSKTTFQHEEKRMTDEENETGREALGKLSKLDPFLVPDKPFIFLARFDGVRVMAAQAEGEQPETIALVTVEHYFAPIIGALY
jgi:hypothetical protein